MSTFAEQLQAVHSNPNEQMRLIAQKIDVLQVTGGQGVAVPALGASANITAVPGSFADVAAVQAYLAGANVVPNIESRLDALEAKVNALILSLHNSGQLA